MLDVVGAATGSAGLAEPGTIRAEQADSITIASTLLMIVAFTVSTTIRGGRPR